MAYVVNNKGYLELYEQVRDPITRKNKKRFVRYLGRATATAHASEGVDWAKIERDEVVHQNQVALAHEMYRDLQNIMFKEETGLDLPSNNDADPAPIDKTASPVDCSPTIESVAPADAGAEVDDGMEGGGAK